MAKVKAVKVNFKNAAKLSMPNGQRSYSMGTAIISREEYDAYKDTGLFTPIEEVEVEKKEEEGDEKPILNETVHAGKKDKKTK